MSLARLACDDWAHYETLCDQARAEGVQLPFPPELLCEAGGCWNSIVPGAPSSPGGGPPGSAGWFVYRVPPGWAVSWVIGDGSNGFRPSSRMVVLCPLHHTL